MLRFFTSLSFLYILTIAVLLLYGFIYYRSFAKNGYQRRLFPYVFFIISASCFFFLYFNFHAPLKLKTFSNLDHYFIRHDGFEAAKRIDLGRSDTINHPGNSFNRFLLTRQNNQLEVSSVYSEEPFYASATDTYQLLSSSFPTTGHSLSFHCDTINVNIHSSADSSFEFLVNNMSFKVGKVIKRGSSVWNVFRDQENFVNSTYYTNEKFVNSLKNILLLRDNISRDNRGELKWFLSGRLFHYANEVKYDDKNIRLNDLAFKASIADKSTLAWGIGFMDNNRNQFRVKTLGNDSFALLNRYPVSYPLTEENRNDWSEHGVNKFLVSDSRDLLNMPPVFREGFLFTPFDTDSTLNFSPVLLSYQKGSSQESLQLKARLINKRYAEVHSLNNKLILPAKNSSVNWVFSVSNTFDWNFGNKTFSINKWQCLLFGSLFFFFILVFFSSLLKPANKLSWVWQLLSCISLVLLTTRFFLYWRYKSFPPYDGLDLPSQQQLQSFWNFGIILFATIALAIIFGFGLLKYLYIFIR